MFVDILLVYFIFIIHQNNILAVTRPMQHNTPVFKKQTPSLQKLMAPLGFQKNYPKNIFIPIIQYLSELGLQEQYEECVGTRELYEGKNVVSLSVLYGLISQKWFEENVDRDNMLKVVSNKILLNSKIKKKVFHLKIAEVVIKAPQSREKEFKQYISKNLSRIAQLTFQRDQLINFSNASLYLLFLMLQNLSKVLRVESGIDEEVNQSNESEKPHQPDQNESESLKGSSKQQYRLYIKQIIKIMNSNKWKTEQMHQFYQAMQSIIQHRQKQIATKYNLPLDMFEWSYFTEKVVVKCLQKIKKKEKLTNMTFGLWIQDFKKSCVDISKHKVRDQENKYHAEISNSHTHHSQFQELKENQEGENQEEANNKSYVPRNFTPIVLKSELCYNFSQNC